MKNLETFEAAAKFVGIDPSVLPDVSQLPERFQKAQIAQYKLAVISEAAWKQENKKIDWYNWDQRKYYPWFDMSPDKDSVGSSRGFSSFVYLYGIAHSLVGSRLVYPSREIEEYVGKTHVELYADLMVIN